ncbi:MAG: HAD-IA family hydrolase [Actinomycetota bacterium]|nr:HAD-IA family hydrolase [Actinomycetota bacterium]
MNESANDSRIVFFDLGGVLGDFGGIGNLHQISNLKDDAELWRRWLSSPSVREFESGRSTLDRFVVDIAKEWDFSITPQEFKAEFLTWVNGPMEGALELLQEVKQRVEIGCMSNTNEPHWINTISHWDFVALFDYPVLSFQVGMLKPDREIFEYLSTVSGRSPNEIIFLDDNQINVDAAIEAEISAFQVNGVEGCKKVLRDLGIID